jgi:hypothetical protein
MISITAQFFARPSIDPDCERLPCSFVETQDYIEGNLGESTVVELSNDIAHNWDTKYSPIVTLFARSFNNSHCSKN